MTDTGEFAAVADLRPGFGNPWDTWREVEQDISSRLCLCCAQPGHHQERVEAHMASHGVDGLAVCIYPDMRVHDGHHRVLAARHLGIDRLPVESMDDAGRRWVRDHGAVDWTRRRVGDMTVSEASWVVTDALMKTARGTLAAADDTRGGVRLLDNHLYDRRTIRLHPGRTVMFGRKNKNQRWVDAMQQQATNQEIRHSRPDAIRLRLDNGVDHGWKWLCFDYDPGNVRLNAGAVEGILVPHGMKDGYKSLHTARTAGIVAIRKSGWNGLIVLDEPAEIT